MRIAVCDDDQNTLEQVRRYLNRFSEETGDQIETLCFDSGESFLAGYPAGLDILLLDIRMYEVSGMDIARHIRSFDEDLCIIFISNMVQYALESYQVHAFNFLVKPFSYSVFKRELLLASHRIETRKQFSLTIKNDKGVFQVPARDVIYIETLDHKLLVHTRSKDVVCYTSMNQMEKQLGEEGFFRCHQSFLINLAHIAELGKEEALMAGGNRLPVSRHRRRELIQAMTKYAGEML